MPPKRAATTFNDSAAAPCGCTSRSRPAPAPLARVGCGPSMATPIEAPAVIARPRKVKCQPVDGLFEHRRLGFGVGLAEIPQEQRELVAAEPPDQVRGSHVSRQRRDHGFQHRVSRRVTEGVVDRLQAIDVEHEQRAARMIAPDIGDRAMELALEAAAIENAEKKIGIRGGLEFRDPRLRRREPGFEAADGGSGIGRQVPLLPFGAWVASAGQPARQAPPCCVPPCVSRPWNRGTLDVFFIVTRLAAVHQERIVHSQTACLVKPPSYNPGYDFWIPERTDE